MYDRVFIQQKYILNYTMRAETFQRWKPYIPDLLRMHQRSPGQTKGRLLLLRPAAIAASPVALRIEEVSYVQYAS